MRFSRRATPVVSQPVHRVGAEFSDRVHSPAELTAGYIVGWLRRFRDGEVSEVEVTEHATDEFNREVADALGPTVWNTGCNSWYFTDDGTIDLWPFDRATLTRMLTEPDPAHYRIR